jgi:sulfate-transporting ATPase
LVALARAVAAELGHLVRRLASDWGIAVLLVEHDVSLVLGTCDRVVVVDAGAKIAEGTPQAVRTDPAVVAAYLGAGDVGIAREPGPAGTDTGGGAGRTVLAAAGLHAGYGELAVVRDLDLDLRSGEIVALLGANGAGKTTTLLTLAGDLAPLAGEVRFDGASTRRPLHRRAATGTALLPEDRAVVKGLTAAENLRLARVSKGDAFDLFPELEPLADRQVALLSGGEQQMLSVAIALGRRPAVLLADELSLGLAPLVVDRLLRSLRAAADDGLAVLLVEQHVRRALDVADRAVVLQRGTVTLEGASANVREQTDQLQRAYL